MLIYTRHARDRMAQRQVSEAEVEAVLADPAFDRPSRAKGGRRIVTGRLGGRKVEVVVDGRADRLVVITVWAD